MDCVTTVLLFGTFLNCLAVQTVTAQGSSKYAALVDEVQKWQINNPSACGLDTPSCGVAKMVENFHSCSAFRIVNGCEVQKPLTIGWQVGIFMGNSICSGVLVTPNFVLLAAHCVEDLGDVKQIRVFVGTGNVRQAKPEQIYGVESFAFNPAYNADRITSDSAIIKLNRVVPMDIKNGGIRPACLPIAGSPLPSTSQMCVVSGFGINDFQGDGSGAGQLRYTLLQLNDNSVCADTYGPSMFDSSKEFCALGERNSLGTDTCGGDSGSSLLYKDPTSGRWTIIGIVSFGATNCGEVPGVYADAQKLGLALPKQTARPAAPNMCRSASDGKAPPQKQPAALKPSESAAAFNGSHADKKPAGIANTIADTISKYGCRNKNQCQSNICRPFALCKKPTNSFADAATAVMGGYGGLFMNWTQQNLPSFGKVPLLGGLKYRTEGEGENNSVEEESEDAVEEQFRTGEDATARKRPKQGGGKGGGFGMASLFTKRACQVRSLCWAETWQMHNGASIPIVMFKN